MSEDCSTSKLTKLQGRVRCAAMQSAEIDCDVNFRIWPCCYYQNLFAEFGKTGDPYIDNLPKDWNDVREHGWEKILKHDAFMTHWNAQSWDYEETCSPVCKGACHEDTGWMHLQSVSKE